MLLSYQLGSGILFFTTLSRSKNLYKYCVSTILSQTHRICGIAFYLSGILQISHIYDLSISPDTLQIIE